jgi:hypothetical protein
MEGATEPACRDSHAVSVDIAELVIDCTVVTTPPLYLYMGASPSQSMASWEQTSGPPDF